MATTLLNIPPASSAMEAPSDPGTPASGISTLSTTAIKDGHEGHHPLVNFDTAAERVARLGGIASPPTSAGYFDSTSGVPHTPGSSSVVSTDGQMTPESETSGPNSTQQKRDSMAAIIARRQLDAATNTNTNTSITNSPSVTTGVLNNLSAANSTTSNTTGIAPAVSPLPRVTNASSTFPAVSDMSTDSPASTLTTPSVAEARRDAKMIDGMTYDEGDTTSDGVGRRGTITLENFSYGNHVGKSEEDVIMDD